MARRQVGLRNAAGLGFSRECAPQFYLSFAGLLLAVLALLAAETLWRLPNLLGNYLLEAAAIILAPLLTLMAADHLTLGAYQRTWFELKDEVRALQLLDSGGVALIRRDLATHPILRWVLPPAQGSLRTHLLAAAVWYDALLSPEGAPWLHRYGQVLVSTCALALTISAPLGCGLAAAQGFIATRAGMLPVIILASLALAVLCVQQLRVVARRQAILDYFAAYRGS